MKDNFIKFSYKLIFFLTIGTAAAMPLFFVPVTSEFFETNKFTLFLTVTIVSLLVWAVRMILQKRFTFTRSPLDIPFIVLIAVFFIATLSSLDQFASLTGFSGRPWPSLFSTITLVAFYFVSSSNLRTKKQAEIILWTLASSSALAALISIVSYFGVFAPLSFTTYRAFNPLGSANTLSILEAIIIPLCLSLVLFNRNKNKRILAVTLTVPLVASLILINFVPAYFGLIVGLIIVAAMALKSKVSKYSQIAMAIIGVLVIVLVAVRFIPQLSSLTLAKAIVGKDKSVEISKNLVLPQNIGWDISASAMGKRPLFGTGPATYQFAFTQLKSRALNSTTNWAIRFDKSSSDFSEMITTIGIVGTLAFLLLIVTIVRFTWSLIFKNNASLTYLPSAAAIVTFCALTFFATSTFSIVAIFFLLLTVLTTLAKTQDEKHVHEMSVEVATLKNSLNWIPMGGQLGTIKATSDSKNVAKSQVLPAIFLLIVLVASFFAANYQIKAVRADVSYHQALLAADKNDGLKTIDNLQKAISINPNVDLYHRALSNTALSAAITLNAKKDLNDDQKKLLSQLASVAIQQGQQASGYKILPLRLPGISASNTANWESLAAAYKAVIGSITGADVDAVNTLSQASSLDPENPVLHDKLGLLYQQVKNYDLAQRKFEDSTVTKADYGPGYYHLAKLLIDRDGDPVRIATALSLAKQVLPKEDPAISDIESLLKTYNQKVEDLQKQANSPEASPTSSTTPTPKASPRTSASPDPSPIPSPTPGL